MESIESLPIEKKPTFAFFTWYFVNLAKLLFVITSFYLFLLRSWVGEDAFIFFKYIDNFVNGHGLVFNLGERVEGFTAPLWVFVLSFIRYFSHWELRPTAILLGLVLSTLAVLILIYSGKKTNVFFPLTIVLLVTNSAFRDFATSGFETSLTYLLLVLLLILVQKDLLYKKPFLVSLLASLLVLNRPEAFLIYAYFGLMVLIKSIKTKNYKILIQYVMPGLVILGGYQIFRMGYFAALLPNTFYAKKGGSLYILQGYYYLRDFALSYPITILMYTPLTLLAVLNKKVFGKSKHLLAITLLLVLYVLYAGGDYMHGRSLLMAFISWSVALIPASVFLIEWLITKYNLNISVISCIALILIIGLFFAGINQVPLTASDRVQRNNINDERMHFGVAFKPEDFFLYIKERITAEFGWRDRGFYYKELSDKLGEDISIVNWNIGFFGYASGERVSVLGGILIDPYLARMDVQKRGKIGHENGPEWQYILSLKPTFSYTPFKYWNESAHAKWEGAKHARVLKDDTDDSYVPVFDLSNKQFLDKFSALAGKDIKKQIDTAQVQFLADVSPDNKVTYDFNVDDYFGFLKVYWYPYAEKPAQHLFDAAANNLKWREGQTVYEKFYANDYKKSQERWERVKSPMTVKNFMLNISYSMKDK